MNIILLEPNIMLKYYPTFFFAFVVNSFRGVTPKNDLFSYSLVTEEALLNKIPTILCYFYNLCSVTEATNFKIRFGRFDNP
jgi:hypothetical protein